MSDDNHMISVSLKDLVRQMASRQGMDREPWWTDADHVEYDARIHNGKLIVEYIPIGQAKKRTIQ